MPDDCGHTDMRPPGTNGVRDPGHVADGRSVHAHVGGPGQDIHVLDAGRRHGRPELVRSKTGARNHSAVPSDGLQPRGASRGRARTGAQGMSGARWLPHRRRTLRGHDGLSGWAHGGRFDGEGASVGRRHRDRRARRPAHVPVPWVRRSRVVPVRQLPEEADAVLRAPASPLPVHRLHPPAVSDKRTTPPRAVDVPNFNVNA